jgi:hypothetical protein
MISVSLMVDSLLGTMGEIEATVDDLAAHHKSQRKAILCHDCSHSCVAAFFELFLFHHVCIIALLNSPVNRRVVAQKPQKVNPASLHSGQGSGAWDTTPRT